MGPQALHECQDSQQVYELALKEMAALLDAPRLLILTGAGPVESMQVRASRGLPIHGLFHCGEISLELLQQVHKSGEAVLLDDARDEPEHGERLSVVLAGLRSVMCTPLRFSDGMTFGILYADNRERAGAFSASDLGRVLLFVERLEQKLSRLKGVAEPLPLPAPAASGSVDFGSRPEERPAVAPSTSLPRRPEERAEKATPLGKAQFLRSLGLMTRVGVSLMRALEMLSLPGGDAAMQKISQELFSRLGQGHSLAQAMAPFRKTFTTLQLRMVRVGEQSGSLPTVLERLADHEERALGLRRKLQGALLYPFFLSLGCMAFMLLGPPYLFADILRMTVEYEVELSWVTRAMIVVSNLVTKGGLLPLVLVLVGCVWSLTRLAIGRPGGRYLFWKSVLGLPYLGKVMRDATVVSFTRALWLQLAGGVSLLKALPDAIAAADNPLLHMRKAVAMERLRAGDGLLASLNALEFFPEIYLTFVEVGVNSGDLPRMIGWMADYHERQLEHRLEVLTQVLEPLLLLVMGILVALILVGTLSPMVAVLQTF